MKGKDIVVQSVDYTDMKGKNIVVISVAAADWRQQRQQ